MSFCSTPCTSTTRLDGKTALITGANTGIGRETAKDFFIRGARVIMACRTVSKANDAIESIKNETAELKNLGQLHVVELNLMSLQSVRQCAKEVLDTEERLDILINNAGVMMCPYGETDDGFETHFGTNHLGHFLLTVLLLPKLIASKPSRIVTVSAVLHNVSIHFEDLNYKTRSYSPIAAYSQSKCANILFARELATRLAEHNITGVNTYSLHPGAIDTELQRHTNDWAAAGWIWKNIMRPFAKSPLQGAQTTIYCAVDEQCADETGLYYTECASKNAAKKARDPETAKELWDVSWKLVGLDDNYNPFVEPAK